ncbi:hypothetical protein HHK36_021415 [Tetracentron sinense]|uniref:TPR1-like CTLH-containing domain-containing protein n=1 Tax=Tetracentron sinense TaxID=13715 RepID=A0A834YPQ9_TETSI|nr:hypothetical protein HHK36_021415 [Tetracentron sinense]
MPDLNRNLVFLVLQFLQELNCKEAVHNCRRDRAKALDILVKELKVFSTFNDGVFKQLTELLFLENFRSGRLSRYQIVWMLILLHSPNPNCGQDGAQVPSPVTNTLAGATPETKGSSGVHGPYQPAKSALHLNIARWIANPFPTSHPTVSVGPRGLTDNNRAGTYGINPFH